LRFYFLRFFFFVASAFCAFVFRASLFTLWVVASPLWLFPTRYIEYFDTPIIGRYKMKSAVLTILVILAAAWLSSLGCKGAADATDPTTTKGEPMTVKLTSTAFKEGQPIPKKYSGEGDDISPPLAWSDLPNGAVELALIVDDPDAPSGTWTHWVIYNIPAALTGLDEGASGKAGAHLPDAAIAEGKNSAGKVNYHGPMPPPGHGTHHYYFTLYALDKSLSLDKGPNKAAVEKAMQGHILAKGQLMGTYERR
jgi:Raf kinase inhibitor-like YbhB/YbcL family protein